MRRRRLGRRRAVVVMVEAVVVSWVRESVEGLKTKWILDFWK